MSCGLAQASLQSYIEKAFAVPVLFSHGLPLGVGGRFPFHTVSTQARFLLVFRFLYLRKLWANEDCVTLLTERLHVGWAEWRWSRSVVPGELFLLVSVTQQTWLRKLHGTSHVLEVSCYLFGSFKISGDERRLVFSCVQSGDLPLWQWHCLSLSGGPFRSSLCKVLGSCPPLSNPPFPHHSPR